MNRFDGFNTNKSNRPVKQLPAQEIQTSAVDNSSYNKDGYFMASNESLKDAIKKDFRPSEEGQAVNQPGQQKQQQAEVRQPQESPQQDGNAVQPGTDEQQKRAAQERQQDALQEHKKTQTDEKNQQSQQQQQASPIAAELRAKWKQHVASAKLLWAKLTDTEILQSEGRADRLSGLIVERYAVSQQEADSQVKQFIDESRAK